MEPILIVIQLFLVLLVSAVWVVCALDVRRHPEKMAGYNTMPRKKLDKVDLPRIGRFISNMMFAAIPFMLVSPLMPNENLFAAMLASPPIILCGIAALYVNIFKKRFHK